MILWDIDSTLNWKRQYNDVCENNRFVTLVACECLFIFSFILLITLNPRKRAPMVLSDFLGWGNIDLVLCNFRADRKFVSKKITFDISLKTVLNNFLLLKHMLWSLIYHFYMHIKFLELVSFLRSHHMRCNISFGFSIILVPFTLSLSLYKSFGLIDFVHRYLSIGRWKCNCLSQYFVLLV